MVYKSQREWGWPIAVEIFCGGTAGGTYIISVISYLLAGERIFLTGVVASIVLVLISVLVLLAHLPSIWRASKVFLNPQSPLTLGAVGLSLLIIFSVLTAGIMYTGVAADALYVIAWLGAAASLLTLIYPGILMGMMKTIPFWSGPAPSLLVLSATLLSGTAMVTVLGGLDNVGFNLRVVTLWLLAINGLFLLIYIIMGKQGSKAAQMSVQKLVKGSLSFLFTIGVVIIGLFIPLILYILNIWFPSTLLVRVSSILVLIGGVLMRYSLIAGGIKISVLRDDAITATYWLYH
jgi:formate-dependent nitrite reductase membrane component NrfD